MSASEQSTTRLVAVADLDASAVTVVEQTPHGALAVGISDGRPFAVSNRCRHLFASLGKGRVTEDGCLQCPWHGALYDVVSGKRGLRPEGPFQRIGAVVKATPGANMLKTVQVELCYGAI